MKKKRVLRIKTRINKILVATTNAAKILFSFNMKVKSETYK